MLFSKERSRADADAFGRVLAPLLTPAYRLAFGLALDPAVAEAAVIKAARKARGARGQLRPGSSLWRWFATVVRREVRPVEMPVDVVPPTAHEPELRRLRRLTFGDRTMLLMHYYVDLSMDELAAVEGLSKVDVRARLALARERARPLLTDPGLGAIDDSSIAHLLRALIASLGDPRYDFQRRVGEALGSDFRRASYQRPTLAVLAAGLAVLGGITLAPGALKTLRALPLRTLASSVPRPASNPLASSRPTISLTPISHSAPSTNPPETRPATPVPSQPTPAGPASLVLSDAGLPSGVAGVRWPGVSYSASGGTPPYRWSVAPGSPFGLTVSPSGGSLSIAGTPSSSGSATVTVTVTDARGVSQSRAYSLTIGPALALGGPPGGHGEAGVALPAVSFSASGGLGGYSWSVAPGPPPGLSVASSGGSISVAGTPTTAGSFSFTVTVTDAAGVSQSAAFALQVETRLSIGAPARLPDGRVGQAYSQPIVATGGLGPYTWDGGGGLGGSTLVARIQGDTIVVWGTPTAAGDFSFTATVRDACQGCTGQVTQTFTVHVSA